MVSGCGWRSARIVEIMMRRLTPSGEDGKPTVERINHKQHKAIKAGIVFHMKRKSKSHPSYLEV